MLFVNFRKATSNYFSSDTATALPLLQNDQKDMSQQMLFFPFTNKYNLL